MQLQNYTSFTHVRICTLLGSPFPTPTMCTQFFSKPLVPITTKLIISLNAYLKSVAKHLICCKATEDKKQNNVSWFKYKWSHEKKTQRVSSKLFVLCHNFFSKVKSLFDKYLIAFSFIWKNFSLQRVFGAYHVPSISNFIDASYQTS